MSNTIILDSYDYAEALKAANVPEAQIKVIGGLILASITISTTILGLLIKH
jgi:hypothetical protein